MVSAGRAERQKRVNTVLPLHPYICAMKKIVVLSGAGISADSGLKTFRGSGGLWEGHVITDVATPEAFERDPALVLRFYNARRRQLDEVQPNAGHLALAALEQYYEVSIVTQNVDDLHERAGSSRIMHLHGELRKKRSTRNPNLIEPWTEDIVPGDPAPDGGLWRPHIVWFGEEVSLMEDAAAEMAYADLLIVVGTSLVVYPAAGLVHYAPSHTRIFVVDPNRPAMNWMTNGITFIEENAADGLPRLVESLILEVSNPLSGAQ